MSISKCYAVFSNLRESIGANKMGDVYICVGSVNLCVEVKCEVVEVQDHRSIFIYGRSAMWQHNASGCWYLQTSICIVLMKVFLIAIRGRLALYRHLGNVLWAAQRRVILMNNGPTWQVKVDWASLKTQSSSELSWKWRMDKHTRHKTTNLT